MSDFDDYFDRVDGHHLDKEGRPISMRQWGELRYNPDGTRTGYERVGEETIGSAWVSTVWVGMAMLSFSDAPLIFETMIFDDEDDDLDLWQNRYATEAEAEAGHAYAVAMVRDIKALDRGDLAPHVHGVHAEDGSPDGDEADD